MENRRQTAVGSRQRPQTRTLVLLVLTVACCLLSSALCLPPSASAQFGRRLPGSETKPRPTPTPAATPAATPTPPTAEAEDDEVEDGEAVRIETNLVTMPVIASDRGGHYVTDLKGALSGGAALPVETKLSFSSAVNRATSSRRASTSSRSPLWEEFEFRYSRVESIPTAWDMRRLHNCCNP